jgi:hypothetical protein
VEASEAAGNVCFKQIGRGMTACVKSLCQTHHQKASSQPWASETGTFYIKKTDTVIFMDPKVSSEKMTPDLYQYFLTAEQSIEEWSEKFAFIASSDSESITMEQVASGEANNRKASDYKTPTKTLGVDILPELGLLAYQREVMDPESLAADDRALLRMARILGDIESTLIENAATLNTMHAAMCDELSICRSTSGFLLTKIERSQALVGKVSGDINNKWVSPTLWGTVSEITNFLDNLENVQRESRESQEEIKFGELFAIFESLSFRVEENRRLVELAVEQKTFLTYARTLKSNFGLFSGQLQAQMARITSLELSSTLLPSSNAKIGAAEDHAVLTEAWLNGATEKQATGAFEVGALASRLDKAEDIIKTLVQDANGTVIAFGGLGLKSLAETRAWSIKRPEVINNFGLIVDCFSILEWLNVLNTETLVIGRLKTLSKMGVETTLAEARSMSSFHSPLPKIFMGNGAAAMVIQKNESHLPGVKTHAFWSNDGVGLRSAVAEELKQISEAIVTQITNCFEPGSIEASTARLALGATLTWLEKFMAFVDTTYLELIRSSFTPTAAWSLTTRIMSRIFADIHSVRLGVAVSFKKSDVQAISANVLWATFKTLDAMEVFSKSNFSDHPAVSAEYVKFLASNTGMDSMSKFTDALKKMGDEVKESAVKSSNATKQVLLVSNKVDEVKAKLLTLERRLTRLESK